MEKHANSPVLPRSLKRGICTEWKYCMGKNDLESNTNRKNRWKNMDPVQRVSTHEHLWACRHTNWQMPSPPCLPCVPPHRDPAFLGSMNISPLCKCADMCADCADAAWTYATANR